MFTIEALKAKHGDCLIVRWGKPDQLRTALIDGGPDLTYTASLKPRLAQLAGYGKTMALDLVMVSHIDDDHINGLLDLTDDILAGKAPVEIKLLWFNSLEKLLDGPLFSDNPTAAVASMEQVFPPVAGGNLWEKKVIASVGQGQILDGQAKKLGLDASLNWPYDPLVVQGALPTTADIEGLQLTPVAPSRAAMEVLRKVWKEKRRDDVTAAYRDRSPYNLSSIVTVAKYDGKTMLLTGDALGRDVLEGLEAAGLLDARGCAHFDLIKLPHHGSPNNVVPDFFERLTADHYLVSGDQDKFPNPHPTAMKWLADARLDAEYRVYCPYSFEWMSALFGKRFVSSPENAHGVEVIL